MEKLAFVVDYKYCMGCHVCDVACRKEHAFEGDDYGITIAEQGPFAYSGDRWEWNYLPIPTSLCDLCKDRREKGTDPTCIHHCLAKCIELVPLADLGARLEELGETAVAYTVKA